MNAGVPVVKLDWDSRHFGLQIARIQGGILTRQQFRAVLDYSRRESIECLYFLADSADIHGWAGAIEAGFRPIDIRVELDRSEPDPLVRSATEELTDLATEADLPTLLLLGRSAFTESRFYRDENFPAGKAEELFALWIERGVREPDFFTVLRRGEGRPTGFLTARASGNGRGNIELVAVSDEFRGKGVGAQLLDASLAEFRRRGCQVISVATQGSNIAAQRLYQARGFRTRSIRLWFHLWIK